MRRSLVGNPLSRPATARLAASRLTSHSNGPGSVSSKSLTSKTRLPLRRRERPEIRQMSIPAQLHPQPRHRCPGQIRRHRQRRPPIERERRHQHPPMPDRHQLRHPALVLLQQQPHRIPRLARHELRLRLQRRHRPGILAPRHPIRPTQLLASSRHQTAWPATLGRHVVMSPSPSPRPDIAPQTAAGACCRHTRQARRAGPAILPQE